MNNMNNIVITPSNKNDKKSTRKWTAIAGLLLLIVFRRVGEWVRQYKGSPKKHETWKTT